MRRMKIEVTKEKMKKENERKIKIGKDENATHK